MMQIVIFDDKYRAAFYPICLLRSVGDIRCGVLKLRQRLESVFSNVESDSNPTCVIVDKNIEELYRERHADWLVNTVHTGEKLFLNSRIMLNEEAIKAINELTEETALVNGSNVIAIRSKHNIDVDKPAGVLLKQCHIILYDSLSDVIHDNARMLVWDFNRYFYDKDNFFETEPGVTVLHPYNIWIGEDVTLSPGVVLNAADGPIILDSGVQVMPNAVLTGPLYIGKHSIVKIGAKIYGNTSIGPVCKVGGEIEGSIFQAYSNKQHDGFLGHSYIGEWVN
ncbi:MAG: putative sugar nucleotidyl transferase, partial [Candidatus Cloacimonetes bacterium]|nr:putative sugar nucleotidyl transferase [Candidatus Cloacimonadota bacterium]